jgi:hypothetical protein
MHYKLLQETIDSLHDQNPEDEHLNFEILAKCPLLEACINEALRVRIRLSSYEATQSFIHQNHK